MIREISVSNFKSLRNVNISLGPLSIFCGPNASGKTNFVEALDFLSQVFRNGLQYAVSEKGGFYNICFRRIRRTKGAIYFRILVDTKSPRTKDFRSILELSFSIRAKSEAIRAEFIVEQEEYRFSAEEIGTQRTLGFLKISRTEQKYVSESWPPDKKIFNDLFGFESVETFQSIRFEDGIKIVEDGVRWIHG